MKDDMPDLGERQIRELVIIAVTCLKPERIQVRNLVETCVLISTAAYVFIKDQYKKKTLLPPSVVLKSCHLMLPRFPSFKMATTLMV